MHVCPFRSDVILKMPEFYIQPMRDRKTCFKCNKTGKKKLFKCAECEAITYCNEECQREDWSRHEWNCVPVMVTEILGKGRGIVAAKDIKMGEEIFIDKPVIKLDMDVGGRFVDPDFRTSLMDQIENLPAEAKIQYYKLTTGDQDSYNHVLKLFLNNCKKWRQLGKAEDVAVLYLNIALVNHSCVPNATVGRLSLDDDDGDDEHLSVELRAAKDISKGEEITTCYYEDDVKKNGSILRKRKTAFKKSQGFDCTCPVCQGQVPFQGQEKVLKKLIELHKTVKPASRLTDCKKEAGLSKRIADLTMELKIGDIKDKISALFGLAKSAHLARDRDLMNYAMDKLRQLVDETKMAFLQRTLDIMERRFNKWSIEFQSGTPPEKKEIEFILGHINTNDIEVVTPLPWPEVD